MSRLHNYMEDMAQETYEDLLAQGEKFCGCDKCRMDVLAMVLNKLPPKYIVTQKGAAYTKLQSLNMQFKTDVLKEMVKAFAVVAKHPRH